jgi:hypothetical protein
MSNDSSDKIDSLPTNENLPSKEELETVETFFIQKQKTMTKIFSSFKDIITYAIIFMIISLPQFDEILKKFVKCTNDSIYILLLVKTLIFCITVFLVKNIYLTQKN